MTKLSGFDETGGPSPLILSRRHLRNGSDSFDCIPRLFVVGLFAATPDAGRPVSSPPQHRA